MMPTNNPTSVSATVGQRFRLGWGPGAVGILLRNLLMPAVLVAFATYLLIGILTMAVPEGTVFPGPQFFPALIAGGLYLFAVLLGLQAVRNQRRVSNPAVTAVDSTEDEEGAGRQVRVDWISLAWIVGSFLGFALLLNILGWVIGAALLFVGIARGFSSRRWVFGSIVGLAISSLTYVAFDMALGMSLPSGILGWGF